LAGGCGAGGLAFFVGTAPEVATTAVAILDADPAPGTEGPLTGTDCNVGAGSNPEVPLAETAATSEAAPAADVAFDGSGSCCDSEALLAETATLSAAATAANNGGGAALATEAMWLSKRAIAFRKESLFNDRSHWQNASILAKQRLAGFKANRSSSLENKLATGLPDGSGTPL